MTQKIEILTHLQQGKSISAAEAVTVYSCYRLAARINDLRRDGHEIKSVVKTDMNGKRYARYSL